MWRQWHICAFVVVVSMSAPAAYGTAVTVANDGGRPSGTPIPNVSAPTPRLTPAVTLPPTNTLSPTPSPTGTPPTRTATSTWTPNTTPTWTPRQGGSYLCRAGNQQGKKCGLDADCPGGLCTFLGHARICQSYPHCELSGGACIDNYDCPLWNTPTPAADYCNNVDTGSDVYIACTTDADCKTCDTGLLLGRACATASDCKVCLGGSNRAHVCASDTDCPSSTCAGTCRGAGACTNGMQQYQAYYPSGSGAVGDTYADYVIGGRSSVEDNQAEQVTAASMALPLDVTYDPEQGTVLVTDIFTNTSRVQIFDATSPRSFMSATRAIGPFDLTHAIANGIPGDFTLAMARAYSSNAEFAFSGQGGWSGKCAVDTFDHLIWCIDGRAQATPAFYNRMRAFPFDANVGDYAVKVLGHQDFSGTVSSTTGGKGFFTSLAIARLCDGGTNDRLACARDANCSGGTCGVTLAALAAVNLTNSTIKVWKHLETVANGQTSDQQVAVTNVGSGLAFDTRGNLWNGRTQLVNTTLATALSVTGATVGKPAFDSGGNMYLTNFPSGCVDYFPYPHTSGQNPTKHLGACGTSGASSDGTRCDRLETTQGDVTVDTSTDRVYVADPGNRRVLSWPSTWSDGGGADIVLGQRTCTDTHIHQVGAHSFGSPNAGGIAFPYAGGAYGLFMCDQPNNRCLYWADWSSLAANSEQDADSVIGQTDATGFHANQGGAAASTTLSHPGMVGASRTAVYVADTSNNQVKGFPFVTPAPTPTGTPRAPIRLTTNESATWVYGPGSCGPSATTACAPTSVKVDPEGNLYIVSPHENRVLFVCMVPGSHGGFCTTGNSGDTTADLVVGQMDLTSNIYACDTPNQLSASSLCNPVDVTFEIGPYAAESRLLVSDFDGLRVLGFPNLLTWSSNGPSADLVLGRKDASFTRSTSTGYRNDGVTICTDLYDALNITTNPCRWEWEPFGPGPTGLAFLADGGILWAGAGAGVVEFNEPLSSGMAATRVAGSTVPHWVGVTDSGYVANQWPYGGGGIAPAPAPRIDDICVMSGIASEEAGGVLCVKWPMSKPTFTPTPVQPTT